MAAALPWPCDDWSNEARSFCPSVPSPACWDVASSGSSAWYDCDIEPTTTSLATNPVISAARGMPVVETGRREHGSDRVGEHAIRGIMHVVDMSETACGWPVTGTALQQPQRRDPLK